MRNTLKENQVIKISAKLYREMYEHGGDKLIALYAILHSVKDLNGRIGNFKGERVVRNEYLIYRHTNIKPKTVALLLKQLVDLNLVKIQKYGSEIQMVGLRNMQDRVKVKGRVKRVPIIIGKTFLKTAANAAFVRVHSEARQQEKMLEKKQYLLNLQKRVNENTATSKEVRTIMRAEKVYGKGLKNLNFTDDVVMSLERWGTVIKGFRSKVCGSYYKKKYKNLGKVKSERRFKEIPMSLEDFFIGRALGEIPPYYLYDEKRGKIVKEVVSKLEVC
jgi:hypothetical protein